MKKVVILVIIVLIIIGGFLLMNNNEKYSREDVLELLNRKIDLNNIYIYEKVSIMNVHTGKFVNEISKELKFKDNIGIDTEYSVPMIWYVDYSKNEAMQFYTNKKTMVKAFTNLEKEHPQYKYTKHVSDSKYSYKYKSEEKYNNENCIVFEISTEQSKYIYWINKDGIVQKIEIYTNANSTKKWVKYMNIEYKTELNHLTDNDMLMPNKSEYTLTDSLGKPIQ